METFAQCSVRHCLDMIASFEATEEQKEKGQLEFYQFMVSIYQEMYERPEDYMVFPIPYEAYRERARLKPMKKEKEHTSDSRESTLRNTIQQAIQFYATYFYNVGLRCTGIDEHSGALIISRSEYMDVIHIMSRIHESKYNIARYEVLERLGIRICERGDDVYIGHEEYTQAMEGLLYLCKAPESKYKWMNFLRLDYKNAYLPTLTVEDICKTLSVHSTGIVRKLEENLAGMKIKARIKPLRGIVSDFRWKVEYSHKGKNICGFYADMEYFMLCLYFNNFQNITEFAKVLYEQDRELFDWFKKQFPERLCKCPSNRRVYFANEPCRICGLFNKAEIVNPDEDDVGRALHILRTYRKLDN